MTSAGFSFAYPIQLRWRDFDALGHVNNATYLTFVEAGRLAYQTHVLGTAGEEQPWVVAEIRCRYVAPINLTELGQDATLYLRIQRLGSSSLTFAFALCTGKSESERRVAEGEVVQVHVSPETGRPAPLPEPWRARIEAYEAAGGATVGAA